MDATIRKTMEKCSSAGEVRSTEADSCCFK